MAQSSILPCHTARHFDMEPYTLAQDVQQDQSRMDGSIAAEVVLRQLDEFKDYIQEVWILPDMV